MKEWMIVIAFIIGIVVGGMFQATKQYKEKHWEAREQGRREAFIKWRDSSLLCPHCIKIMDLEELDKPNVKEWRK